MSQTNDQERYELAEKIILDLVNKNERLLKEKEIERKEVLVMSVQQRVKIQTLEKQLEAVKEHSQANNIKNTTLSTLRLESTRTLRPIRATVPEYSNQKKEHLSTTN